MGHAAPCRNSRTVQYFTHRGWSTASQAAAFCQSFSRSDGRAAWRQSPHDRPMGTRSVPYFEPVRDRDPLNHRANESTPESQWRWDTPCQKIETIATRCPVTVTESPAFQVRTPIVGPRASLAHLLLKWDTESHEMIGATPHNVSERCTRRVLWRGVHRTSRNTSSCTLGREKYSESDDARQRRPRGRSPSNRRDHRCNDERRTPTSDHKSEDQ